MAAFKLLARFQENPEFREQFLGPHPQLAPKGIGLIARLLGQIRDFDRERRVLQLLSELSEGAGLHEELAWIFLAEGDLEKAEVEAQLALEGTPQDEMTNVLMAAVALKSGVRLQDSLDHFSAHWPGLFRSPPVTDTASDLVVASTALVLIALGETEQGNTLLQSVATNEDSSPMARAIALANGGQIEAALAQLETYLEDQNNFDTFPGDPFWEPLWQEPRFQAILALEDRKDAQSRDQIGQMIERGDLVLPMAIR
jgi:hypothetical protein